MATTIQVGEITKQKLLQLKMELSLQNKIVYTFDDAIQYLLNALAQEKNILKKTFNRQDFQQYKKSLGKDAREIFKQERKRDLKAEEKYIKPKA